jgi:enamine deaminase RidA (YjgF/YER057c/UK114 family)
VEKKAVNSWSWGDAFGFSQATEFSGHKRVLVCSGQTSVDENGSPVHAGDMNAQVKQAMENVGAVLKKAGMDYQNIVRLNFYTTDVDAFFAASPVIQGMMGGNKPAGTLLGVARLAFPPLMIELEATAVA